MVSADDIVRAYRGREGTAEKLLVELRRDPEAARAALDDVLRTRRGDIRAWCAWLAARSLPKDKAVALALRVAKSRDPDVAHAALEEVEALDPAALRPLIRRFRRMLRGGKDWYDTMVKQLVAMRLLAAVGDRESIDEIRALRDDPERPQNVRDLAARVVDRLER